MGINILGTGMYVPEMIADNEDFARIVDTSDEWIMTRTGIKTRHINNGELAFQMGTKAAQQAIGKAGIRASDIDMILGTTCTSDFLTPSLACMVGNELGINDAPAMDLNAACAGYVFALDMAQKYLDSGDYNTILIVSAEIVTRMVDYTDRSTCVLFGDGAAATVVTRGEGMFYSVLRGDPSGARKIFAKQPEPKHPFKTQSVDYGDEMMNQYADSYVYMAGNDVYKFATVAMPAVVAQTVEKAGVIMDDLRIVIPHQANMRIIKTAVKKMNIPLEKCYLNISRYGNISSACIPLAMTELTEQNAFQKGDKICLVGFGAGLVYGACVFEW